MVQPARPSLSVVIGGHVDHGKSTVIGRLLADTGSLPDGRLEQVRALCERTGRPFEYAFLLDALRDERAQGITIDTARVFFRTAARDYLILDAPGHVEFVRNLVQWRASTQDLFGVVGVEADLHPGIRAEWPCPLPDRARHGGSALPQHSAGHPADRGAGQQDGPGRIP